MVLIFFAFARSLPKWLFAGNKPLQQWLAPSQTNVKVRPKPNVSAVGGFLCRLLSTSTEVRGPRVAFFYTSLNELLPTLNRTLSNRFELSSTPKRTCQLCQPWAEQRHGRLTKAIYQARTKETNGCRHSLQLLNQSDIHAQPSATCYEPQTAAV